jgi:hypothetical protein
MRGCMSAAGWFAAGARAAPESALGAPEVPNG